MRAGIQPGDAAAENFGLQFSLLQINSIQISNFQFTACRRLYRFGHLYDAMIIKINSWNSEIRFRDLRLLLNAQHISLLIKFHNSISFGIVNPISENDGS